MDVSIKKADRKDYGEVLGLAREVYNLHVENRKDIFTDLDVPIDFERFCELINDEYCNVFIAVDKLTKEIVAYSIIKEIKINTLSATYRKSVVYVEDFCVKFKYRRCGIGRRLFSYILEYSKSVEAKTLELTVWEFNKSAIAFYNSIGLKVKNFRMEISILG